MTEPVTAAYRHPEGRCESVQCSRCFRLIGPEVTHACPPDGAGLMPCCGRSPAEVPMNDRLTVDSSRLVTCGK